MGKFEGILICTDLDGTSLKNDKTISKNNLDAIEKIIFDIEKGIIAV
ncbi:MAG: HAD hydrolase family protein [Clostridia bacterium]|nr:HAD hydrolase family protein [Clostridia bacterium]